MTVALSGGALTLNRLARETVIGERPGLIPRPQSQQEVGKMWKRIKAWFMSDGLNHENEATSGEADDHDALMRMLDGVERRAWGR